MYRKIQAARSTIKSNTAYQGERIEEKINRILNNGEPIKDGAPRIYTERKDGVLPQYDIRTDRFEIAVDAMDKVTKSHMAKREQRLGDIAKKNMEKEQKSETKGDGGTEPTPIK